MPATSLYRDENYDSALTKYVNEHLEDNSHFCACEIFLPEPVRDRANKLHTVEDHKEAAVIVGERQDARRGLASEVAECLLRKREDYFFSQFIRHGIWARDVTGAEVTDYENNKVRKWRSSNADANPLVDITRLASEMGHRQRGHRPNRICMARNVWDEFRDHPKILNNFRMRGIDGDAPDALRAAAALFGVDKVLIMELPHIKENFLFLFYQEIYSRSHKLNSLTAGVNFVWKPSNVDVEGANPWIRSYSAESRNYLEAQYSSDFQIASKDCGTLIEELV